MSDSLVIVVVVMLSVLLLVCTAGFAVAIALMSVVLEKLSALKLILMRVENAEEYLRDLSSEVNQASTASGPTPVFRSLDGKHSAASLDELIQKMMSDPSSGISSQSTPEELKRFFDQISQDDDEEDDEDDTPKWK